MARPKKNIVNEFLVLNRKNKTYTEVANKKALVDEVSAILKEGTEPSQFSIVPNKMITFDIEFSISLHEGETEKKKSGRKRGKPGRPRKTRKLRKARRARKVREATEVLEIPKALKARRGRKPKASIEAEQAAQSAQAEQAEPITEAKQEPEIKTPKKRGRKPA